jgi:putative ABC transport system substrate-binding protein
MVQHRWLIVALAFLLMPLAADAQRPGEMPRIGIFFAVESPGGPRVAAFRQGLHDLGYVESQNIVVEYRYGQGKGEQFPAPVAELVHLKPVVLVIGSGSAALAAKKATQTIPIVFVAADPVGQGLVESLVRPGGNLTGLSFAFSEGFAGKWVELLKEAAPGVSHVAVLGVPANPVGETYWQTMQVAAQALGVTLQRYAVREPAQFDSVFAALTNEGTNGLIVDTHILLHTHRHRVVELAAKHRLPAMYTLREYVDAGGLMAYSMRHPDLYRRAATYVDKILKGTKPADLPVEQPMQFELIINLKTAKALGMTIPPSLLLLAEEVLQ